MGGVHIDGGTENHEEFDSSWVGVHVPNCELFGGRSRYKESSLVARPVLRAEGVLEDSQPNSGYTGSAYPILSLVQGNYHPQSTNFRVPIQNVKGVDKTCQWGGAKVYHQRSLASVNVRASCSGEVSQRQAGSRLGG